MALAGHRPDVIKLVCERPDGDPVKWRWSIRAVGVGIRLAAGQPEGLFTFPAPFSGHDLCHFLRRYSCPEESAIQTTAKSILRWQANIRSSDGQVFQTVWPEDRSDPSPDLIKVATGYRVPATTFWTIFVHHFPRFTVQITPFHAERRSSPAGL